MPDQIKVNFLDRVSDFAPADWSACFPPPLEGRFWYQALEDSHLQDQFRLSYARLARGERTIGIAPCFLHDVPMSLVAPPLVAWTLKALARFYRGLDYQRTLFIGSPCSDEGTVGLVPGVRLEEVLAPLREAVVQRARSLRAPMVVFKDFADGTGTLVALGALNGFCPVVSYPGTVLPLPAADKEAYYRSLTHLHRHNYLKKLRRSRALLETVTEIVTQPSPAQLQEILGLFRQTYARGRTKFERLELPFFAAIARQRESRFIMLRVPDGALVAFMLVFVLGGRLINKFIGLDYSRDPRTSLYFRLFDAALDLACAEGVRELQSGQTGYRAKLDLGHELVPLYNVFRHANPAVHWVYRAIGSRIGWKSLDPDLKIWLEAHPEVDCALSRRAHRLSP